MFIISDAGCGHESPYTFEETRAMDGITIHKVNVVLNVAILAVAQFLLWVPRGFWFGFFLGLALLFLVLRLAVALASRKFIKKYACQVPFSFNWKGLLHIPFSKYINLVKSRATSMYSLTDKVYMKHIRSLNYATIYEDEKWQNRRIMNALYELGHGRNWGKNLAKEEKPLRDPS